MSAKCCSTALPMFTSRKSVPSSAASSSALERVRLVVPKQGMVTAKIPLRSRPSRSKALAVMRTARVESSPPDSPTTAQGALVCSSRFLRPRAAMVRISSQRSPRRDSSVGRKGVGEMGRVRVVVDGSMSNLKQWNSLAGLVSPAGKVFTR